MRFDILSRDLNVFEPHFLEASAGTGKTFAIQHLVARLLIEGNAPLNVEQILLVTFTKAATRELKLRIRRTLESTKQELATNTPSTDYLQAICEQGTGATKAALERIDAALICFDAAQIFTLHGFCHRVLREFAFEAGSCMQGSDPESQEHLPLLQRIVQDHLKEGVTAPDYSPVQIKSVLSSYKNAPRKMISGLVNLISSGIEIAPMQTHLEACQCLLREVQSLPLMDAEKFQDDLALLTPLYKEMTGKQVPAQIALLGTILSTHRCSPQQFDQLLDRDFFLDKMGEENVKKRVKGQDPARLHYPGLIEKLRSQLLPCIEQARNSTCTLLRLARELQEKSATLLEQQETFSLDALLLRVEQALKMPHFAAKVRQKYRAAIIDEFQDTDPVQWNIFKELFLSHIDALCLVGDPKQSIYAFRNADVYVYLDAAKAMGERAKKHLDTNFRSTAPLVEALNLLFSRAQGGWMDLPGKKQGLEVPSVKAGSALKAAEGEVPIQFFVASSPRGRSKSFPTEEMFETHIFPYIASEISLLHTQGKVAYHDIAILVKDRFQGRALIDHLKEQGIPARSKRGTCITESSAYFALQEMLDGVLHPNDMSKMRVALGGPILRWDVQQLLSNPLQIKAHMQVLCETLHASGFAPFFQQMLRSKWGDSTTSLEQEMLQRGDLSLYLDLRELLGLLIEEERISGLRGETFLHYLKEIGLSSQSDENRFKVLPGEEQGSVIVMTTHMSKGLEFDTVFALGIASRHKPSEHSVVKQEGRSVMIPFNPSDPACQRAIIEGDAEKMRQLYVALTRAKRRLYIPLMLEEECKEITMGEASAVELFFAKLADCPTTHTSLYATLKNQDLPSAIALLETFSPLISTCILQASSQQRAVNPPPLDIILEPPDALCLPKWDEKLFSFTSLSQKNHSLETIKPPDGAPLSPHTLPLGTETGQLLHLIFEKIFKRGLHHPLNEPALFSLIEEEIAFSALEKWKPILAPWIVSLLKAPCAGFLLCDVPRHQLQPEMEFYYPIASGAMKGFADLVFTFKGKYYLLDWKSNYLGPSDADYTRENIVEVMHQHQYTLQASIYAEALERYVKLFDTRPFSECFGGAIYYFVRGSSPFHFMPEQLNLAGI